MARWNSQTCRDTLMTQDLVHGKGQTVGMGDTVDVALSSWLLQNHAIVQVCVCLRVCVLSENRGGGIKAVFCMIK